ncbi:MAG TPA: hypothetical protein VLW26_03230 [Steroidobacteraceae bacterium]|nr:hypothetical protein [Steroidobacteraceae bacterium]
MLLMPGKLSTYHQKYEEQCVSCHDRSDRSRQTSLCRDCHKDIDADIRQARGFHGRLQGIAVAQCRACHSEHLGRAADIVKLSPEQFDHALTSFPLQGAHAALQCSSCHQARARYRDAPHECIGCHRAEEPHEGRLGRDCAACHQPNGWRQVSYDHSKTAFPLHDKHASVACAACHFGNRYRGTPQQCVSCHAPDDVHHGERGPRCADCHTTAGWKSAKFDHARETGFALEGAHAHIDCQGCHRSGDLKQKIPRDCHGCHEGQDPHAGRLGVTCDSCHGNEKWRPANFDHSRDGHWELVGRHQRIDCHACHTAAVATQKLSQSCASCHQASDVHAGSLGTQCEQCHTPEGWRTSVVFDHDLTRFPLVGLHVAVPCEGCHLTRQYRDTGHQCIDCHRRDDVHHGNLGSDCARCHSPNGWRIWEFDHGKQTGFALSGAHGKLACVACHRQPADVVKLKPACVACHAADDVHLGQFGQQCDRCHSSVTFKGARQR